jgi:hypothetical protein
MLAACGGGDSGSEQPATPAPLARNVLPVTVDRGPLAVANVNIPYVSVRVCAPGSTTVCQTIDHVLLDTASTGLRIIASVLDPAVVLPAQTDGNGNNLAECVAFVDGYAWGAVRLADVQLGSLTTTTIPIQIIGDTAFPNIPTSCSSRGAESINTVESFGSNGVLGVSTFAEDCGSVCERFAVPGTYYACPPNGCNPVVASVDRQVKNPVAALVADNNGFIVEMPSVPAAGAVTVSGTLTLGIGTQSNNSPGTAIVLDLDASGNLKTIFKNQTLDAFFDSGSNALFFADSSLPVCDAATSAPGFYCPVSTQDLAAVVQGASNGTTRSVDFSVANAAALVSNAPTFTAFANIAAPSGWATIFDWGLPFFYGRRIFMAIEQRSTPVGTGPYIAY